MHVSHRMKGFLFLMVLAGAPLIAFGSDAAGGIIRSAVTAIDSHYLYARPNALWDKAKDRLLHATYKTSAEVYQALVQQIATVGDSELNVLSKRQLLELQKDVAGDRAGIGLVDFSIDTDSSGNARIVTPIFGTPSAEAGVQAGDIIESVNGRATRAMTHEQVIDELRRKSPAGIVALNLQRGQRRFRLLVHAMDTKLAPVQVEAVSSSSGGVFGYIRIVQFTPESGQEVRLAVSNFERDSVGGYILDLRNNPGGLLDAAAAAASAFTPGPFGFSVHVDGKPKEIVSTDPVLATKPIIVLINNGTASAAEVLTAALMDHSRATVVGATSHGRGQAQTYYPLTEGYGIALPSALVQSPRGKAFNGSGLKPDIELSQNPPTLHTVATKEDAAFVLAVETLSSRHHEE